MTRLDRLLGSSERYVEAVYEEKRKRGKARRSLQARFRELDRLMKAGKRPIRLEEPPAQ
ncbi:MAG: hypothetical protein Q8O40_01605 [Chloroflexota bacterium]|nr:hypothetical protein [Chloroflexota bacterium]